MNNKLNYILGIDVGISSVGWGILELDDKDNPYKIVDAGSRIFTPGEVPKTGASKALERREKRGIRRIIRRRELRVDRVRYLLYKNKFLNISFKSSKPDKQAEELTELFNAEIQEYYKEKKVNPYILKYESLSRRLTPLELGIILVHYAKHRGYKSNREENNSDTKNENGKIKDAISNNNAIMIEKKYSIVSEMFIKDKKFNDGIRNSNDNYKMSVNREMYLEEIEKVLDSQIKYGLINEEFKDEYLKIWSSQRNYSKGPGGNSPYGGNLIEKMVGECKFTHEPRAAKCNPSSELFVAISKLVNLRYKGKNDSDYKALNNEQIKKIIYMSMNQDKVSYANIKKILELNDIIFKGLDLSKKQYLKVIVKFKNDILNIDKDNKERIDFSLLTEEQNKIFEDIKEKEILSNTLIELKTYSLYRKEFSKVDKEMWEKNKYNLDMLDKISTILTNYKVNDDIIIEVKKTDLIDDELAEFITSLPNCKDHMMLSRSLILKLVDIMISGVSYNDAMLKLGYNFSDLISDKEKNDILPALSKDENISNQRVLHSLSQTRKVINAIIKKYGLPQKINIETARELAKTKQERIDIEKSQKEKFENNVKTKELIADTFPKIFKNANSVSSTDLLKYNLWKEQKELCGYSMMKISIDELFDKNKVQIDHILPYSRTFNDSYLNKTLVLTKMNQDKKNKTPYEWFGNTPKWEEYKKYINDLVISSNKKDNYLLTKLTPDIESEMREQNLNDTKYISKFLVSYIKSYLNVDDVQSFPGIITGKLRGMWGLNGLTHSLDSSNYRLKKDENSTFEDVKKNRENHLHHALDALVIASINKSLEIQMSNYEKYKRYLQNNTEAGIKFLIDNNIADNTKNNFFDDLTGELDKESIKKYVNNLIKDNYLILGNNGRFKFLFPQPYINFSEEAIVFVYEQNKDKKISFMRCTHKYSEKELEKMAVLTPSFAKPKISGKLHGETLYGALKTNYYSRVDKQFITSRIDIASRNFTLDKLEDIVEKNGGSKDIYISIKNWLTGYDTGEDAYKNKGYPIVNNSNGKIIKKIKIQKEYDGKGHFVNGAIVEKENIYKIGFYHSKDIKDEKLYAVGYDLYDLNQIKRQKDFVVTLWYGQLNNKININYSKLNDSYTCVDLLSTNQLVNIIKTDNSSGIAYLNGLSSGMLEVKSALGDNKDLYGNNKLFENVRKRYQITVSTIKDIMPLSISILGEISGIQTSSNK